MTQETGKSYVMDEQISHGEKQTPHDSKNHEEILRSFHHNISHLDKMIQKINTLEQGSIKNTDTVNILNGLLKNKNIGGANAGAENKAYFKKHGDTIVLVLNSVVDGRKVDTMGDIGEMLAKVDRLLTENPLSPKTDKEKEGEQTGKDLAHFQHVLSGSEKQLQELNSTYQNETNDVFRVFDAVSEQFSGDSGKMSYERTMKKAQENIWKEYVKFSRAFEGKILSPHDQLMYEFQKRRFQGLLSQKIESPESFIHYVTHSEQSLTYAWEGAKGMTVGAAEGAFGIFVLLYGVVIGAGKGVWALGKYTLNSAYRQELNEQISKISVHIGKHFSREQIAKIDKKMITEALQRELEKVQAVPPAEQAHMIGQIAGNIIGTIASGMFFKGIIRSDITRVAYKEGVADTGKALGNVLEGAGKGVARLRISKAKNWKELDEAIDQIDHIRFKEGLKGDDIRSLVEEVKNGTKPITALPHAGRLQETVAAIKAGGGEILESGTGKLLKGLSSKTRGAGQEAMERVSQEIAKHFPEAAKRFESLSVSMKTLAKTGYNALDMKVTKLRTEIERVVEHAKTGTTGTVGALMKPLLALTADISKEAARVDFPGKKELLASLTSIQKDMAALGESLGVVSKKVKKSLAGETNPNKRLSEKAVAELRFEGGLAIEEVKDVEGKTLFYQYRNTDGKVALKGQFKEAGNFHDGQATVKLSIETEHGPKDMLGIIDRKGKWVLKPKFDVLHSMSDTVKIGREGDKYYIYRMEEIREKGKKTLGWTKQDDVFDFMTDPREGMAVAVKKIEGQEVKFIINEQGVATRVDYKYIDDFAEEGIAAAQDHKNVWRIINKRGEIQGHIQASSNLEALDQYHMRKFAVEEQASKALQNRAKKLWNSCDFQGKDSMKLSGVTPLSRDGTFIVHAEVDGRIKQGFIDIHTGKVTPPQFDHIQRSDEGLGFFRVKQKGKWGIANGEVGPDGKAKMIVNTRYDSINIQDDVLLHMEVRIADKVGLIDRAGKEIIPVEFSDILSDRKGVFRGVKYDENLKVVAQGEIKDFSSKYASDTNIEKDFLGKVIDNARNVNIARSTEVKSARTYQRETSTFIRELEHVDVRSVLVGFNDTHKSLSLRFRKLSREVRAIEDKVGLDRLIDTTVRDEFETYAKNYGKKLTRDEKKLLKDKQESIVQELKERIQSHIQSPQSSEIPGDERQKLIQELVENINPSLYRNLGGKTEEMRKRA